MAGLQRALRRCDKTLTTDLKHTLEEAAAPVKQEAERLATSRIRNVGHDWSRMRIGSFRSVAYVAPVERGAKGRGNARLRRPKFKDVLLDRAMEPALANKAGEVEARFDGLLDELVRTWDNI